MNRAKIVTAILAILVTGSLFAYFLFSPQRVDESPDGVIQDIVSPLGIIESPQGTIQYSYRNMGASTTLSVPDMQPDMELGLASVRIILPARTDTKEVFSFNAVSWVFIEKNGVIHAEHIYGVEFLDTAEKNTTPKLVPGGLIYTDIYGTVRKFHLADLATVKNIADPTSLHFVEGSDVYLADARKVYFLKSTASGPAFDPATFSVSVISRADPATFTVFSKLPRLDLAVDKQTVYLHGEARADIDRATFRALKADYSYRDAGCMS